MSAAVRQCGTVCELHWFDTAPEHIHQPPVTLADQETLYQRRVDWTWAGAPEDATDRIDAIGPKNPRAQLFMFMQDLSRTEVRAIVDCIKTSGDPDALEYPLGYLVQTIRSMDEESAAEAWELFGQGLRP